LRKKLEPDPKVLFKSRNWPTVVISHNRSSMDDGTLVVRKLLDDGEGGDVSIWLLQTWTCHTETHGGLKDAEEHLRIVIS
jgi:hypothetical protein